MTKLFRIHLNIYGKVQDVFFRAGCVREARLLGLTGWVKNLPDGSVELVAEGESKNLERFLDWCGKGPEKAIVKNIRKEWGDAEGEFDNFKIIY